jgi:hypothetical protein
MVDVISGRNLITHTRLSGATTINELGRVAPAVTNLLLQSEDFTTTWLTGNYVVTPNAAIAPSGLLTADKLVRDTVVTATSASQSVACLANTTSTLSCFVKAAEWSKFGLREGFATGNYVTFDLVTASVISSSGATGTITAFPDGWYRVAMQMTTQVGQTTFGARINPLPNSYVSGTPLYGFAGDNTSGLFVWGAQLEQSATMGEYVPTGASINSAPRITHDPVTLECLGFLPEEQKANLTPRSEEFNDATWVKARASITANAAASPSGAITADKLVEDNTANNTHVAVQVFTFAATTYTLSIFAKAAERSWVRLFAFDGVTNFGCYFNLSAGTVGTAVASTGFISPLANGWFRCVMTFTAAAGTGTYAARLATGDGADVYTGDGTSGLFVWGAQLEVGGLTSYIPTAGSSVVRAADAVSITGANFSSWYRQDEGTIYVDGRRSDLNHTASAWFLAMSTGVATTRLQLGFDFPANGNYAIVSSGTLQGDVYPLVNTLVRRAAAAYSNNCAVSYNGASPSSFAAASLGAYSRMDIGAYVNSASGWLNGPIARLDYWPRRLPNSILQELSR